MLVRSAVQKAYFAFWVSGAALSKGNGWVPIDKNCVHTLKNINRPFSWIEALFSYSVDQDEGREGSINGYSKLWGWSRNKVRKFIKELRTVEGHFADSQGTLKGHPIHFIDKGLWVIKDNSRTIEGQLKDILKDTTIYPNPNPDPNPNKTTRGKKFQKPSLEEVKAYCLERKNEVDPQKWLDHYTAKGWMIGKNKMKDWKAAIRTWEGNNGTGRQNNTTGKRKTGFSEARKAGKTDWLK